MTQADLEAQLKSDGYTHLEAKTLDPRPSNTEHAHDYDIRGLVLDGGLYCLAGWSARELSRGAGLCGAGG